MELTYKVAVYASSSSVACLLAAKSHDHKIVELRAFQGVELFPLRYADNSIMNIITVISSISISTRTAVAPTKS